MAAVRAGYRPAVTTTRTDYVPHADGRRSTEQFTRHPWPQRTVVELPSATIAKLVAGLIALSLTLELASQIREVLIWCGAALFLAIALNPLVARIEPRIGRTAAVLVVFTGFLAGLLLVISTLVAPFVTQVDDLTKNLPAEVQRATQHGALAHLNNRFDLAEQARQHAGDIQSVAFGAAGTVLNGVLATVTVLFLTAFILFELPRLGELILSQLRPSQRARAERIAYHVNRNVGGYVAGNLVISLICGVVTTVSLFALGVPYSLVLGVFMAVFDIIPLVGATIGAVGTIAAVWVLTDLRAAIAMFVIVMIYQQVENHLLQPMIYRRTVRMSSFTIVVALLAGAALLGFVGALLAVPIAGTITAVVHELLDERAARIAAESGQA
jgi:predicted PurR-regulated permease PerM